MAPLSGYFKVTGQVSQRHPFHGFRGAYISPDMYDVDISAQDRYYKGVLGHYGLDAQTLYQGLKTPFWGAVATGLSSYFVTRLVARDKKLALRVALVGGGVHLIMSAIDAHLRKQVEDAIAASQAPATGTAPGTTVAPGYTEG